MHAGARGEIRSPAPRTGGSSPIPPLLPPVRTLFADGMRAEAVRCEFWSSKMISKPNAIW
jgi:hypothetical protein